MVELLRFHIGRGGGVIAGGQGLGILIGQDPTKTPVGWIFVDSAKEWTDGELEQAMTALRSGRSHWPGRDE